MRVPRVYISGLTLTAGLEIELETETRHYLVNVLRLSAGRCLTVFNGQSEAEADAILTRLERKSAIIRLGQIHPVKRESTLQTQLALGISKPEHMDYGLQKAVELGVSHIQPLICARSQALPGGERSEKRMAHWLSVIISACEQSGRCVLPPLAPPLAFLDFLQAQRTPASCIMLSPSAGRNLKQLGKPGSELTLVIGPEGGFSDEEENTADCAGLSRVVFGPRILRTETAVTAALTAVQLLYGDLAEPTDG